MKKFKYKFTKTLIIALIAGMILALACIITNANNLYKAVSSNTAVAYNYISALVSIIIGIIFLVIAISMFLNTYYGIDQKYLIMRWGVIYNKYELSKIREVVYFTKSDKLVVYYNTENYFVIFVKNVDYNDFISSLVSSNKNIAYTLENEKTYNK